MNVGERAELLKWWDVLDQFVGDNPEKGLQMARGCLHHDARWLASLFPGTANVTQERMVQVLLEHPDDPRALYLAASICPGEEKALTLRAAEMGYAPAQTDLSFAAELRSDDVQMFRWAKKACKHRGDRPCMSSGVAMRGP
jgi:hypothetical protein